MNISDARSVLGARGWLAATPADFRDAVLGRCELRRIKGGTSVYRPDDPPGGLWGLAAGGVAIELASMDRGALFGHFAGPGFWIGAGPTVTRDPRRLGVVATRTSVLLRLPMAEFEAIAARDPQAWRWLAVLPIQQSLLAAGVAADLMIRDPRRRLMATLLRLAACHGPLAGPEPREIVASQEELATIANLSRTALGEMLRDFERQGLIARRYRRITVDQAGCLAFLGIPARQGG